MSFCRLWAAALVLLMTATTGAIAQTGEAQTPDAETTALFNSPVDSNGDIQLTSLNLGGGAGAAFLQPGCGQFFAGAEYTYVRALPSEAIAFLETTVNGTTVSDTFRQFDFQRQSNVRLYGGYRLANCGEEIRFTYTSFDSDAGADSGVVQAGSNTTFQGPLDIPATDPGDRITADANVSLDNFDLGWSKTIPIGCPMICCDPCCGESCGADCCGTSECGSCCGGCCWCPAWDITFTGALRIADYGGERFYQSFADTNRIVEDARSTIDFSGVGARVGMQGRRYLGRCGMASVYMKGDISLLVGDVDLVAESREYDTAGTTVISTTSQQISCTHVIPVTEIEAGGTVFLTCNTSLSGGYMLGAWHDLGFREEFQFAGPALQYDDANIMAFEGFFVRLESAF